MKDLVSGGKAGPGWRKYTSFKMGVAKYNQAHGDPPKYFEGRHFLKKCI